MRSAWRLCSSRFVATALNGDGARLYGGRWNHKGTRLVYCSSTLALAMLEVLVHASVLPTGFVALRIEVPDPVTVDTWSAAALPAGWQATPAPQQLARLGSAWVSGGTAVALEVPSAIVEVETNLLLNPLHPDMARLVVHAPIPFPFDSRLR
jgi:RES domain-containing protein